jgi:hypothetical protein
MHGRIYEGCDLCAKNRDKQQEYEIHSSLQHTDCTMAQFGQAYIAEQKDCSSAANGSFIINNGGDVLVHVEVSSEW